MLSEDAAHFYYWKQTGVLHWKSQTTRLFDIKGKTIPVQAWTDPEGARRLRLPDFKTISPTHQKPIPPRKYSWYSFLLEDELTPGP